MANNTIAENMHTVRTVYATVKTPTGTFAPRAIRFEGLTFADLKARLAAVNLPGVTDDSYLEVRDGNDEYVCLLDQDSLPAGDVTVNVHSNSAGKC